MCVFFSLLCPLHPLYSSCAEVFHESTNLKPLFEDSQLTWSKFLSIGKRFFFHTWECVSFRETIKEHLHVYPVRYIWRFHWSALGLLFMQGWHACCSCEENNLRMFLSSHRSGGFIFAWANFSLGEISRGALKGKVGLVRVYLKIPPML